jgi:hypothetical protein
VAAAAAAAAQDTCAPAAPLDCTCSGNLPAAWQQQQYKLQVTSAVHQQHCKNATAQVTCLQNYSSSSSSSDSSSRICWKKTICCRPYISRKVPDTCMAVTDLKATSNCLSSCTAAMQYQQATLSQS